MNSHESQASLKFQPIRRPQAQQKSKSKAPISSSVHKFSSSTVTASASSPEKQGLGSTPQQQPTVQRSNFEDWIGEDDDYYHQDQRARDERRSKKKKNKNKGQGQESRVLDWDDIYDPTLPNNYVDYKGSEEQHREIRDWKARLYYHQLKEARKQGKNGAANSDESEERPRPTNSTCVPIDCCHIADRLAGMFAPPQNLNFAPPSFDDNPPPPPVDDDDGDYYTMPVNRQEQRNPDTYEQPPPFSPSAVPDDESGEDAYMRRMRMSGMLPDQPAPPPPASANPSAPTPPPSVMKPDADMEAKRAEAQAKIAAFKAKLQKKSDTSPAVVPATAPESAAVATSMLQTDIPVEQPPPPPPPPEDESGPTISRAPVRYDVPPPPAATSAASDTVMTEAGEAHSETSEAGQAGMNRPTKKGFAERLMKKMGWEKGQGLGAQGEGITTALVGKADKRKKRGDAEGGGWAQPKNMGKIVGGKRRKLAEDETESTQDARFGKMSEVIKLDGMLNGLDVQKEVEENNLMQEIGDEMGNKHGNVERVFIWREEMGGNNEVFVKFTSQLGALRTVNETDGMTFAENDVVARFWDAEKFEKGEYA